MFMLGFTSGLLVCFLWSYYHHKKRQRLVSKVLSSYDALAMRYFTDYQNREESGAQTIH